MDIREATPNTTNVEYETVVEFTCNVGYILAHNHEAEDMITTCLHTAQWDKQVPDCRGILQCQYNACSLLLSVLHSCDILIEAREATKYHPFITFLCWLRRHGGYIMCIMCYNAGSVLIHCASIDL